MALSPRDALALLDPEVQAEWLQTQPEWALRQMAAGEWWWTGRPEQQHPPGDWFVWLLLSGRGFGKTRTAAEWLLDRVERFPFDTSGFRTEWLVIAETESDAMAQCVYGPAGIKRVLERRLGPERMLKGDGGRWHIYRGKKPLIQFYDEQGNDAQVIYIEGADDENVGRGYNASGAWLDELAKWKKPDDSWREGIMPSLRADLPGDHPRCIVATTPKPVVQLIEWSKREDGTVVMTTGSTYDNAANLAAPMLAELHRRYHGTRLGAQELHGRLIEEAEGALWHYEWIERHRVRPGPDGRITVPPMDNVVVAIDAAGSDEPTSAECGLVAAGRGEDGDDYVLGDWTKRVVGHEAGRRAWEMVLLFGASVLIVETNQGKRWLTTVLRDAYTTMQDEGLFPPGGSAPIVEIHAKIGKKARAEPVAARDEQGRIHHAAAMPDLETQMISWVPEQTRNKSPDRIDARVYCLLYLQGRERLAAGLATPADYQRPALLGDPFGQ